MLAIYPYGDDHGCVAKISSTGDDRTAVCAARVSFLRDDDEPDDKRDERLLRFMIKEGHTSPFEHASITLRITCPMFVRSQIMRHRTFSFNEVSRRYTSEDIKIYVPTALRMQSAVNLQCSEEGSHITEEAKVLDEMDQALQASLRAYSYLLFKGVAREQARGVLPQNTYTTFWMTGNLHNWFKFLKLRLHDHSQEETRLVAKAALSIIQEDFPLTTSLMKELGKLEG